MSDDVLAEARALADAAGIVRRDDLATLRVTGEDRVDYLHRMLTQDIAGVAPGQVRPACLLEPKGRILGEMLVWNVGDALLLEVPRAALGAVSGTLEKFVIMDDAKVGEALLRAVRFDVIGATAPDALASLGVPQPEPATHAEVDVAGVEVRVLRHDLGARPRFVFRVPEAGLGAFLEAVDATGCVRSCSAAAYEIARIEEAEPIYGAELSEDVLFNEAGLPDHVSFQKGCYPGQEPVLMAKHRGRPPRRLCALTIDAAQVPPGGTELLEGGKAVGTVTSAVQGVVRPGIRALAYVRAAQAEEGASFALPGGGTAVVERVRSI